MTGCPTVLSCPRRRTTLIFTLRALSLYKTREGTTGRDLSAGDRYNRRIQATARACVESMSQAQLLQKQVRHQKAVLVEQKTKLSIP